MKKILFSLAAVCLALAGLTSCSDDVTEVSNPVKTTTTGLVINGTLNPTKVDGQTRVDFTEGEGNALKAKFETGDYIRLWFRGASGNDLGHVDLPIDESTISSDGRTAQFHSASVTIPESFAKVYAILAESDMSVNINASPMMDDLSSQDGSLEDALRHSLFKAYKDTLYQTDTIYNDAHDMLTLSKLTFQNSTAILKLNMNVLADEGVEITTETPITVTSVPNEDDNTTAYYNKVHVSWGVPGNQSTKGDDNGSVFTIKPNTVTKSDNGYNVTAYMAVWPVEGNSNTWSYSVTANELAYFSEVEFTKALSAGYVYTASPELEYTAGSYKHWYNDEARQIALIQAGRTPSADVDWITYENGNIVLAENTSGKPRKGTLSMQKDEINTDTYEIVQIEAKDFKNHQYSFLSDYYSKNGDYTGGATALSSWQTNQFYHVNPYTLNVTFGEPRKQETLPDYGTSNQYTNNIGIRGLFGDAVLDAAVVIDYDAMTCKLGLFCDTRDDDGTGQLYEYDETLNRYNTETGKYDLEPADSVVHRTKYAFFTASLAASSNFRMFYSSGGTGNTYQIRRNNEVWPVGPWRVLRNAGKYNVSDHGAGSMVYGGTSSHSYAQYTLMPTQPGWISYSAFYSDNNIGAHSGNDNNHRQNHYDYLWIWLTLNDDLDNFVYSWTGVNDIQTVRGLNNSNDNGGNTYWQYTWNRIMGITVGLANESGITDTSIGDGNANHPNMRDFNNVRYQFSPSGGYWSGHGGYTEMKMVESTTGASGVKATGYKKK